VARAATTGPERHTALESILAGCDRAARAIDQLLTLARLDPGDAGGRREECDLREVAKQVLADVAPMALAKGVDVELVAGPPVVMLGNPGLLAVLLRNVVDNAVRYSLPGGSARVDVVRDGTVARLVVTDEGPGVAPGDRQALGQRFHRLAGSRESGTGLGLSIVKRVAELHQAAVRFQDGPGGRGLCVVVELPGARPAPAGRAGEARRGMGSAV
jgi:signal transduction histidine kinase